MGEFLAFVSQNDSSGHVAMTSLANEWRTANARIRELEASEGGVADGASVEPIPQAMQSLAHLVTGNTRLVDSFGIIPFQLGVVDLDSVVVFQKQVNLSYARELARALPDSTDQQGLFKFAFSLDRPDPRVMVARIGPAAYSFTSPSNDFRVLDFPSLTPDQLLGYDPSGKPIALPAAALGYGFNVVSVVQYKGRLMLANGSHRAYALYEAGIKRIPCLIQCATLDEEMAMMFPQLGKSLDTYFGARRPPMLKDYFDPRLRRVIQVPRKVHQIRVNLQVDQSDIPG